jgi:AcrR family transcriptional regulator
MIAEAAVPLFLEHGSAVTTRQLAENLGIAEGTLFRAFGDKETLVRAVVEAFFAQAEEQLAEGIVDPALPLDEKVRAVVIGMRARVGQVMRMVSLLPRSEAAAVLHRPRQDTFSSAIARAFVSNAHEITVPLEKLGAILRLGAFAANGDRFGGTHALTDDDVVHLILHGIAAVPRGKE